MKNIYQWNFKKYFTLISINIPQWTETKSQKNRSKQELAVIKYLSISGLIVLYKNTALTEMLYSYRVVYYDIGCKRNC